MYSSTSMFKCYENVLMCVNFLVLYVIILLQLQKMINNVLTNITNFK